MIVPFTIGITSVLHMRLGQYKTQYPDHTFLVHCCSVMLAGLTAGFVIAHGAQ